MPRTRRPYPSDLTDQAWNLLERTVASVPREARASTKMACARRIAYAVFYLLRSGCAWRMLPREYPPWQTVSTTTSVNGGSTAGCPKPTSGCDQHSAPVGEGRTHRDPERGGDRHSGG